MLVRSLIIMAFISISSVLFAQNADKIIGKYHLPNNIDIEIYKDGDGFSGKIIALNNFDNGQTKDVNNPDKSKQNNPLIGMVIIHHLKYNKDENKWINGSMYGPEKGMNFNLKVTEIREHDIEVVGSKYIFWKTLSWKKI